MSNTMQQTPHQPTPEATAVEVVDQDRARIVGAGWALIYKWGRDSLAKTQPCVPPKEVA